MLACSGKSVWLMLAASQCGRWRAALVRWHKAHILPHIRNVPASQLGQSALCVCVFRPDSLAPLRRISTPLRRHTYIWYDFNLISTCWIHWGAAWLLRWQLSLVRLGAVLAATLHWCPWWHLWTYGCLCTWLAAGSYKLSELCALGRMLPAAPSMYCSAA